MISWLITPKPPHDDPKRIATVSRELNMSVFQRRAGDGSREVLGAEPPGVIRRLIGQQTPPDPAAFSAATRLAAHERFVRIRERAAQMRPARLIQGESRSDRRSKLI